MRAINRERLHPINQNIFDAIKNGDKPSAIANRLQIDVRRVYNMKYRMKRQGLLKRKKVAVKKSVKLSLFKRLIKFLKGE